jgi:hypothetical protein
MSFKRRWVLIPVLAAFFVALMVVPRFVESGQAGAVKLEGAWIAKVTAMDGVPPGTPLPFQWSYVLAPSASGRSASIHGSVDVAFPETIVASDFHSPIVGEMVQTGPNTVAFTSIWYHLVEGNPVDQIVLIGMARGEARFIGPGKVEATHHFALYLPGADADGDGLPEGTPILTFDATTMDTRVPFGF